jgi:hypothetical protein
MECWPRFAEPDNPSDKPYVGWPKTISQEDNYARNTFGYLPTVNVTGTKNPVVQVIDEATGAIVYTLRINGQTFRPKVFADSRYTVKVGDGTKENTKSLTGLSVLPNGKSVTINVQL